MARKPRPAKKAELYRQELRRGMSCREIAGKYGISVQAVYAACGSVRTTRFRQYEPEACVWVGLRHWMNYHKVSRRALLQKMGLEYSHCNLARLNDNLRGRSDLRMSFIRKMMEITGLTFEELFREDDTGEKMADQQ